MAVLGGLKGWLTRPVPQSAQKTLDRVICAGLVVVSLAGSGWALYTLVLSR